MEYSEHLSEPWFTLVLLGLKKIEIRLYKNRFRNYKVDDVITFYNDDFSHRYVKVKIVNINLYESFRDC